MVKSDVTEERLRSLMLASLDGDSAAYRKLLSELGWHLRPYFTRRLSAAHASRSAQELAFVEGGADHAGQPARRLDHVYLDTGGLELEPTRDAGGAG